MSSAKQQLKNISPSKIDASPEIQGWLSQFPEVQRTTAKLLLSHLQFVSRDVYSAWLQRVVSALPSGKTYALYSVRKLDDGSPLWNDEGDIVARPGDSLGSEDLVYSLVANLARANPETLLDHSSLTELRDKKVHDYLLIDDSIGSGDRVSGFINAMLSHPTFLSWWSFGLVRIHVVSFARPREAEAKIVAKIKGSDHGKRRFRKSSKVDFTSDMVYDTNWLEGRWGENHLQIIQLCRSQTKIPKWARLGYGEVLANTVFYHSVPNNIPGVLWFSNDKWQGLMPGRAMPDWLLALIDQTPLVASEVITSKSDEVAQLLALIKRGVRSSRSIAARLCVDHKYAVGLLGSAKEMGLLTPQLRLTTAGLDCLKHADSTLALPDWDRSLYIPSSWCAGRATVQPPIREELASLGLADSVEVSAFADGDVGQASLERSDAKAAAPPFSVMLQSPAVSRENHDTDGPLGSKDR
ncbi:phosphoribosyltransferase-like protein [Isoalcanivorax beigongshangi]|uniref:Uncharacterized protein n=1 Tax=Isoalcanivorax beigongshangi TaxID=3238810 RepID=A0ABV4AFL4_9GAMM